MLQNINISGVYVEMKWTKESSSEKLLLSKRHPVRQKLLSVLLCVCLLMVSMPVEGYSPEVQAEEEEFSVIQETVRKPDMIQSSDLPEEQKEDKSAVDENTAENLAGKISDSEISDAGRSKDEIRKDDIKKDELREDALNRENIRVIPEENTELFRDASIPSSNITISEDTTWTGGTLSEGTITINEGKTLTLTDEVMVSGNLTIEGGGSIVTGGTSGLGNFNLLNEGCSLTIRNITMEQRTENVSSGLILVTSGTVILDGCMVQNFTKGFLCVYGGTLISENTVIKNCSVNAAISLNENSYAELNGTTIEGCTAEGMNGVIDIDKASVEINGTTITDCSVSNSNHGGIIYMWEGKLNISNSTIKNCSSDGFGAAISTMYGAENSSKVINIRDTVIEGCSGTFNGAIALNKCTLNIYSGTFRNNHTTSEEDVPPYPTGGGFIYNDESTVNIYGGTFSGNSAAGKGGCIQNSGVNSHTNIYGGTFSGNTCSKDEYKGSGSVGLWSYAPFSSSLTLSGNVKFTGDGTEGSGTDGIYLYPSQKVFIGSELTYPATVYLKAAEGYVIAQGKDDYQLTKRDLKKILFVDTDGGTWYSRLNEDKNQIYLTKDRPDDKFMVFYYGVDGMITDDNEYDPGASVTVKSPDDYPIPDKDKFLYWSAHEDGSEPHYNGGDVITDIQDNIHLYAVYEETENKILSADFYSGGAGQKKTVEVEAGGYDKGGDIITPFLKSMAGWTPLGWSESNSEFEADIEAGTGLRLTESKKEYYGVYEKNVTLSYDANGGDSTPSSAADLCYANVNHEISWKEAEFILAKALSREGFKFNGWNTRKDGNGKSYQPGETLKLRGNTTVYAVFQEKDKKTLIADFYSGGPDLKEPVRTEAEVDVEAERGTITAPFLQTFTGWTPLGWSEDKGSYEGTVSENSECTLTKPETKYYGIYEKSITVSYKDEEGNNILKSERGKRFASVHSEITYKDPQFTVEPAMKKDGYTFVEWNTKPDRSGKGYEAGSLETFEEDTVLYPVFVENGKKQFLADFYSGSAGQKVTIPKTVEDTDLSADIKTPVLQDMPGWTSVGWTADVSSFTGDIMPDSELTLKQEHSSYYGIYKKHVRLSYDTNGGGTAPNSEDKFAYANVHEDITYQMPEFVIADLSARQGYLFMGWNTQADGTGEMFQPGTSRNLQQNTNLYAVWKDISETPDVADYQVEYYCQNLTGEDYTRIDNDTKHLADRVGTEVEARQKKYTGYTLNLNHPSGKPKGKVEQDGSLVLKLYYDRNIYEVEFNLNGGYGTTPDTQKVRYGGKLEQVADPVKSGYNFKGWYMYDKGLEVGLWDFESPVENNTGMLKTTLYAKWADETAPVMGEASFSKSHKNLMEWLIQKKSLVITVPVREEGSGLARAEYLLIAEDGTEKDDTAQITETGELAGQMTPYGSSASVIRAVQGEAERGSYEARIVIEEEFKGKVYLTCTDNAGNISSQKMLTAEDGGVILEDNAPKISFSGTKETTGGKPLNIEVQVKDNTDDNVTGGISGICYQTDKGKKITLPEEEFSEELVESCEFTVKISGEGKHTLQVEAEDHAGNKSRAEISLKINGEKNTPAEVPNSSGTGGTGKPGNPLGGEPKTGDSTQIQICATLAMIAGFGYLLLYFEGENGITEQEKEEIVYRLVEWAKQGGKIRRLLGVAVIFLFLAYYHSMGKSVTVEWREVYMKES